MVGDSQYAPSISWGDQQRPLVEFANAFAGAPVFHRGRYSLVSSYLVDNILRGRVAVVRSSILRLSGHHLACLLTEPLEY